MGIRSKVADRGGNASCVCGHAALAHEHYRAGSDCSRCECPRFRSSSPWRTALRRLTRD
ncbi:hypothetical protein [Kineococcus sp. SYSU DK005]|uniref:hypothetical protein n=1 Tax=Kineococcus sp. SYSU DK005 TaxID=3383126 RepID=UPI003D7E0F3F